MPSWFPIGSIVNFGSQLQFHGRPPQFHAQARHPPIQTFQRVEKKQGSEGIAKIYALETQNSINYVSD